MGELCNARSSSSRWASLSVCVDEQVLNKYNTKAVIAKGRYSSVLAVENRKTKEQYALKVIDKYSHNEIEGQQYDAEVKILKYCRHPNIVTLHETIQSSNKVYMVLEYAHGGDLFDTINTCGHFREKRGKEILRMIMGGVSYLHGNGITHRDLKLENLLFKYPTEDSQVLIADFGLAHCNHLWPQDSNWINNGCGQEKSSRNVGMSTTCGTAEYLSPEMLEGEEYCEKVDMWAVGVVAYVVLSGAMPFVEGEGGRARLYHNIKKGCYSFSNQVSNNIPPPPGNIPVLNLDPVKGVQSSFKRVVLILILLCNQL